MVATGSEDTQFGFAESDDVSLGGPPGPAEYVTLASDVTTPPDRPFNSRCKCDHSVHHSHAREEIACNLHSLAIDGAIIA
jgi:hypothetical protein